MESVVNTACVNMEIVCRDVEVNRSFALRRCVTDVDSLREEFYSTITFSVGDPDWRDRFHLCISDFIKKKGLCILTEEPIVIVKDGKYEIEVNYVVGW